MNKRNQLTIWFITGLIGLGTLSGCWNEKDSKVEFGKDSAVDSGLVQELESLKVGTCFDDANEENLITDENQNTAANHFPVHECNLEHDNEVYYIYNLPNADEYKETEQSVNTMLDVCEDKFTGYIGKPYQESYYEMSVLTPTIESWKEGDREVICYAFHPKGKKLFKSLINVNR